MKKKYFIIIPLLLISIFVVLSATDVLPFSLQPDSDLKGIRKRGTLQLVTAFNPTGYFLYRDEPMGFEFDFIKKFAESQKLDLEVIEVNNPDEMRQHILAGTADIMAFNIPVMNLPNNYVQFTHPYVQTELVLVQRKAGKKSPEYVSSIPYLSGKTVSLPEQSPYLQTLVDINFDLHNKVNIVTLDSGKTTEDLIRMVSTGEIEYTVANKEIALVNRGYFNNIDIETPLSPPQDIAFTVHRKHRKLLHALNRFIDASRKDGELYALYDRYFKTSRLIASYDSDAEEVTGPVGGTISVYDGLIQHYASKIGWDWRLVAALIWQESKFKPQARSWAGATGLMQLMPATARRFGLQTMQEIYQPELNIKTGTAYIAWLDEFWKEISDPVERLKFIMASYNAGEGHVKDAQRLAEKYGYEKMKWDGHVEYFLLNKSKPVFYRDPVCKYGYCRGSEPFRYVRSIIKRYAHYRQHIGAEGTAGYDFSLDFAPAYELGLDQAAAASGGLTKRQLFQPKTVFQERTLSRESAQDTTGKYHNYLTPRYPDGLQRKNQGDGKKQIFRKNEIFKK